MGSRRAVGRASLGLSLVVALSCSKGDESTSVSGFGPGPWQLPGDSGATAQGTDAANTDATGAGSADDTGSMTSGPAGSTGGPATTGPSPGSTSMSDGGTFGGADDGGQPDSGWWAHCVPMSIGCDPGFSCLSTDAGNDGVCTAACNPPGDASSCGPVPGGTTMPVCLSVGGDSVCALGCEGALTCPGGMICVSESDDTGPISICL